MTRPSAASSRKASRTLDLDTPGGRVDAFEPDPINRARLERHLQENTVVDRVRVHAVGAGAEAGKVTLYHPKGMENHGSASI